MEDLMQIDVYFDPNTTLIDSTPRAAVPAANGGAQGSTISNVWVQPPVQVLTYGSVVVAAPLSDADLDRIADRVADRILQAKRKRR